MDLSYVISGFKRGLGNFTELPLINMFAEQELSMEKVSLLSRPGLETVYTAGTGPIRAMYRKSGTLSGGAFSVSGNKLHNGSTEVGTIQVDGPVSLSGYTDVLWICGNKKLYTYNGASVSEVTVPDVTDIAKVVVGASRAIAIGYNSQEFYWTSPLGTTFDPLDYATAEYIPDNLRDALFVGDTLILFGSDTVEFWPTSPNSDLPFNPLPGRTFSYGIKNIGAACQFKNTFAWISQTNTVFLGSPDNVLSYPGLDEDIKKSSEAKLWSFSLDGVDFLAVRLDAATWVYNSLSGTWSQFESYGRTNFIPAHWSEGEFGSGVDGRIIRWSDSFTDFGETLERRFRAGSQLDEGVTRVDNLILRVNSGWTVYLEGMNADPKVEARTSKDGGFTFAPWRVQSLGASGAYRQHPTWRGLGAYSYPGFVVEFRVTSNVSFAVSGVTINEDIRGV